MIDTLKIDEYRSSVLAVLNVLLERFEADACYPFIDMKFSSITGENFPCEDSIRGKPVIYSWIQGRGIEALSEHARWIENDQTLSGTETSNTLDRIKSVIESVTDKMEEVRALNGGHVPFMFNMNRKALTGTVLKESDCTLSDLFYFKGLAVSALFMGDQQRSEIGAKRVREIIESLFDGRFIFDQQAFDQNNSIESDCILEGGFMIALGGTASLLNRTRNSEYLDAGLRLIRHVIGNYVNTDAAPEFGKQYDMWEENDLTGRPLLRDGILRSDPGHALEFGGLALKLITVACEQKHLNASDAEINDLINVLGGIIKTNFANGFAKYGIVKSFDVVSQKTINPEMPWWSLPETMRAAFLAHRLCADDDAFRDILNTCSDAFLRYFINRDNRGVAYQCLDSTGLPVNTIPATPDLDPGYHTGLSLIDIVTRAAEGLCTLVRSPSAS